MAWPGWIAERFRAPTFGERGEQAAARHLRCKRYKIVARRYASRYGEFDLIAVDRQTIVFVEVKTRRAETMGTPAEAVDRQRRQRMTRAATAYLKSHALLEYPCRFDIVEVVWPETAKRPIVRHHESAFEAEGRGQFFR